jgi:hypothetical protein
MEELRGGWMGGWMVGGMDGWWMDGWLDCWMEMDGFVTMTVSQVLEPGPTTDSLGSKSDNSAQVIIGFVGIQYFQRRSFFHSCICM